MLRLKDWNKGIAEMFTKKVFNPGPTQPCYGCGKPTRAGFTLCDACYNDSKEVK